MANPWDAFPVVPQGAAPAVSQGDPVIARDPHKISAESRANEDQNMQRQSLDLSRQNAERAAQDQALQTEKANRERAEWTATHNPDGTPKAGAKDATESERTAGFLAGRLVDSVTQLGVAAKRNPGAQSPEWDAELARTVAGDVPANWLTSTDRQIIRAKQMDILDAALTLGTGAAYNAEQLSSYATSYLPQIGDDPATITSKRQSLRNLLVQAAKKAGNAAPDVEKALAALDSIPDVPTGSEDEGLVGTVTDDNDTPQAVAAGAPGGPPPGGGLGGSPPPSGLDAVTTLAKQGVTLGLSDEAAGIGGAISSVFTGEDPLDAYRRERDTARGEVAAARKVDPLYLGTAAEFLGGGAAAKIAPAISTLGTALRQGSALGGVAGFGYGEGGQGSALGALGGATIGAGLGAAAQGVTSALGRRVAGASTINADLVAAGDREGVRVMTSDLRQPSTFMGKSARAIGERIPIAGTGGVRAAQQAERTTAVKNLLDEFGATNADDAVNVVSRDLVATRGAEISRLSDQKNTIISGIPGAVQAPNAIRAIDEQIARLNGINADVYAPVVSKLEGFRDVLASGKSLDQVEGNRKLLGDLFQDPTLASIKGDGQKALNAVYAPLREDMGAFIKQNGGQGAYTRWKAANDKLSAMAGEMDASAFKRLLNKADTTPEAAAQIIFGKTPSDMQRLYRSLSDAGKAKAQSAILYKAAQGAADGDSISPQKFANAMEAMDKATGVFFTPADKTRLDGLTRLIKATQRASEAGAQPATGVQNAPFVAGATLASIFGAKAAIPVAGGIGMLARAYESAPVRNMLFRLGRTQAGSASESKALNGVVTAMSRFAANDNVSAAVRQSPATNVAAEEQNKDVRGKPVK